MLLALAAPPSAAQGRRLSFIRDAEIEHIIGRFAEPIFQVAGIDPASVDLYMVSDPRPNAFVTAARTCSSPPDC